MASTPKAACASRFVRWKQTLTLSYCMYIQYLNTTLCYTQQTNAQFRSLGLARYGSINIDMNSMYTGLL